MTQDLQVHANRAAQAIPDALGITAQVGERGRGKMEVSGYDNRVDPHRRLAALHLGPLAGRQGLRRYKDLQSALNESPAGQPDPASDLLLTQPFPLRIRDRG
jgi:hypothetical protein